MDEHATQQAEHTDSVATLEQEQPPIRRRLGRGLNALLGGSSEEAAAPRSHDAPDPHSIAIELIERNPFQPRRDFDKESLDELTESIKQHGLLQPVLVRPNNGRYQLIAGERRLLASKQAGLEAIPCRVLELEDKSVCEAALEENLKRKDLHVLEKAQAFKDYLERFGSSIEDLAKQLSLNRSTVSNFLRLLDLPEQVRKALAADKITNGHARALLTLPEDQQISLCKKIQSEHLSVRRTEELVRELQQDAGEQPATIPFDPAHAEHSHDNSHMTSHVQSLQEQLCSHLGARVEIKLKGKDAGRVVIHFDSNDQFERILGQLRRAA
jgi:ParB family chromosome partitioning protein